MPEGEFHHQACTTPSAGKTAHFAVEDYDIDTSRISRDFFLPAPNFIYGEQQGLQNQPKKVPVRRKLYTV